MKLNTTYQQDPKLSSLAIFCDNKQKYTKILSKDFQLIRLRKKYNGPFSKEWKNNIYYFNNNIMKGQNIVNNQNVDRIIKSYFHLSFKAVRLLWIKRVFRKQMPFLLKNIMVSKADIKYTNSKVIIRLFSFNARRKYAFFKKYLNLSLLIRRQVYKRLYNKFTSQLRKKIYYDLLPMLIYTERFKAYKRFNNSRSSFALAYQFQNPFIDNNKGNKPRNVVMLKYMLVNNIAKNINKYILRHYVLSTRIRNKLLYRLEKRVRTYEYLYILNKYKFERTKLLPLLTRLLNKYINKKIEYNIINLKSLVYSPDIFTNFINLKIKRLNKVKLGSASTSSYLKRVYAKVLKLEREKDKFLAMKNFEDNKKYIFRKRHVNSNLICLLKERNLNSFFEYIFPSFSPSYIKLAGIQEEERNLGFPRHLKRKYRYIPKKLLFTKIKSLHLHFNYNTLTSSATSFNLQECLYKKPGSYQKDLGRTSLLRTGYESKVHLYKMPKKLGARLRELQSNFSELISKIPEPYYEPSRDLIREVGEYKAKRRELIRSFRVERKKLISSFGNNRKKLNIKLDKLINYFNGNLSRINAKGILIERDKRYYKILYKSKCRNDLISLKSKYESRVLWFERLFKRVDKVTSLLNKERVFDKIKYKRIMGMKIDVNGRLSKRYRADRSRRYKLSEGSIVDIYARNKFNANYIKYRGFKFSNILYSTSVGKVRIGSYGIKGWISCW